MMFILVITTVSYCICKE